MNEFNIIEHFFNQQTIKRQDVILGIGDDCAIVQPYNNQDLLITTDTLVSGIHFLNNTAAYDIGFKSLAVNLSDLAAMGAEPAWITGALTIPHVDETWLKDFAAGLFDLATRHQVQLIGGDLTKGPLTITLQAMGFAPKQQTLRRSGAKPGDLVYVTHTLGDAALGLAFLQQSASVPKNYQDYLINRLRRPEPRVAIGQSLRGIATACIDISDGLSADLTHILEKSKVGAVIYVDGLPMSEAIKNSVSSEQSIALALTGGDDYELCFTVPAEKTSLLDFNCTCIGKITEISGLDLRYKNEKKYNGPQAGYQHFY